MAKFEKTPTPRTAPPLTEFDEFKKYIRDNNLNINEILHRVNQYGEVTKVDTTPMRAGVKKTALHTFLETTRNMTRK